MSLINDALRRTQQTTEAQEPPRLDALELRPIEPDPASPAPPDGTGARRIIWILVLLVVAGNLVLWFLFKDRAGNAEVLARTAGAGEVETPAALPKPEPAVAPAVIEPEPVAPQPAATLSASNAPAPAVSPGPAFKLQTIVSHPVRPSAMINNRVVFVGDRVEGYTVRAIGKNDVTLFLGDDVITVSLP